MGFALAAGKSLGLLKLNESVNQEGHWHGRFEWVELNTTRAALLDSDPDVQFVLHVRISSKHYQLT